MHQTNEKGTKVNHTEHRAKTPSAPTTGLYDALRVFHCTAGTGTSPVPLAAGRARGVRIGMLVLAGALALVLLAPASSFAVFTRPFLRQITGTPPSTPFTGPGGVAVDAEDNLWVGDIGDKDQPPFQLDQFSSAELGNIFLKTLEIEGLNPPEPEGLNPPEPEGLTPPGSLAIERSTGSFYLTANQTVKSFHPYVEVFDKTGIFLTRWPVGADAHVAVDNSTEPTAGTVYVTSENAGTPTIGKSNASGAPVNFGESGKQTYVSASQINGTPTFGFGNHPGVSSGETVVTVPTGIAVDSHGDIYVTVGQYQREGEGAVLEYEPSGLFKRAITGGETPGLGGQRTGGFGGLVQGVAVDPVNGDVLVSVGGNRGEGAIDEFDSSGHFLNQIVESSPGHPLKSSDAVNSTLEITVDSHGDLYASEHEGEHAVDAWGPGHLLPALRLGEVTQRKPTSAVLNGSVNHEALAVTDCHFEYVTEAAFKTTGFSDLSSGGARPCVPAAAEIPLDKSFHPVHAEITGLQSAVTYRYRLLATTAGTLGGRAESVSPAFTDPHAPTVYSTTADNLSSTFADLNAQVNPLGSDTAYHFEYLTAAEFQANGESFSGPHTATSVPVAPADIGSGGPTGSSPETVVQPIGGLAPSTAYRFRVIADNEIGVTIGPDTTFATLPQSAPGLPDNRAYELVTPPDKGDAEDMFAEEHHARGFGNSDVGYPSESGNAFLITQTGAAFGPSPASTGNAYVFSRTPGGWRTISLASPSLGVQSLGNASVFDPSDFSRVGLTDRVGSLASVAGAQPVSILGPPGGPYTTLHADSPQHSLSFGEVTQIVGASHDLSHVVLQSNNHTLAPGAVTQDEGSTALYESAGGGECTLESSNCTLLNVNSKGKLLNRCGAILGQSFDFGTKHNAVSTDGSRAFFTAPDPYAKNDGPGCWDGAGANTPQLFLRSAGSTVEVSAPEAGVIDPSGRHPAIFVGASDDGSRVFFLTETELTKDDAGIHNSQLYEYDTETAKLTRVSAGESGHAAADVFTVPAVSADGSAVYFTAFGQLTSDAPALSGVEVNLYRYDTATRATAYVATVNESDYPVSGQGEWWKACAAGACGEQVTVHPAVNVALKSDANWNTTPDGRYLLFASSRELTGYSTAVAPGSRCVIPNSQGVVNGHCDELYRYDVATAGLACVSCNPSGAPPVSSANIALSSTSGPAAGPPRAISDDGSYVFFDTVDALVPKDTNSTLDVYEWHEGTVSLISSGHDSAPSFFLGSSPDGSNVFFGTHARLVPQDTDTLGDLYDARICTASEPCVKPPPGETAQCEGDACQNPPPAPIDPTPSSLTFSGAGNLLSELAPPAAAVKKSAAQIKAEKLANALKACKKKPNKKRAACEKQARKKYAPAKKKGKR